MKTLEKFTLDTFFQTCLSYRKHCINNFKAHCRILEAVSELEGITKQALPKIWTKREKNKLKKVLETFEGYENISFRHIAGMTYIGIHRLNVMSGEVEKFEHLLYYDSNPTIDGNNFTKIDSWKFSNQQVKNIDNYLQGSHKKPSSRIIMQYNKYLKFFKAIEELKQMAKELRKDDFCCDYYISNPILEEMFGNDKRAFQNAF